MKQESALIWVYLRMECVQQQASGLLRALEDLQWATRQEAGNLSFDILQSQDQPGSLLLVEAFVDEAAVQAHRATPHFRQFKEATAGLTLVVDRYRPVLNTPPSAEDDH